MGLLSGMDWPYNFRVFATGLIVFGAYLLGEHVYNWGFDPADLIGHEWIGLIMVFLGVIFGWISRKVKN